METMKTMQIYFTQIVVFVIKLSIFDTRVSKCLVCQLGNTLFFRIARQQRESTLKTAS